MTYREAVARLYSLERWGIKLGLDNIREFCDYLGNPQDAIRTIHVAGTNGKGSVTALIDSVLRQAGYRVGRYTSPHLRDFRERVHIGGQPISRARVTRFMERHWARIHHERYSYFETATALAYDAFAGARADFGVIEVGLGGRFDATNTLEPALTVITHIHIDHERTLGKSIGKIAIEKAGIIKEGVPVIVGPLPPQAYSAIERIARRRQAPLFTAAEILSSPILPERDALRRIPWRMPLLGDHQTSNLGVALATLAILRQAETKVTASSLRSGVRNVHWPARFQVIPGRPTMIFDVAHNQSGMQAFAETWPKIFGKRRAVALFTTREDKNYKSMWRSLAPCLSMWVGCPLPHSPGLQRATMEKLARNAGIPFEWCHTPIAGYRRARSLAASDGLCLVAGSHYLAGDVMPAAWIASHPPGKPPIQQLKWDAILASLRMPS